MSRNLIQAKEIKPRQFPVQRLIAEVAKVLEIKEERIKSIEPYDYQVWVNIEGVGGKFVSYRRLPIWLDAAIQAIERCANSDILEKIRAIFATEVKKYEKQYILEIIKILRATWNQKRDDLAEREREEAPKIAHQQEAQQWQESWLNVLSNCQNLEFLKFTMTEIQRQKQRFEDLPKLVEVVEKHCRDRWERLTKLQLQQV